MNSSTITAKYQTTVPKDVRQRLGLAVGGTLHWQVAGQEAHVTAATPEWLDLQGIFRVAAGDPVADVRAARKKMGTGRR
jgi:bifunctional DNA-binding transcriptional regulator/antitoxin component of YhaV-PrlF toxin-antitoxin module